MIVVMSEGADEAQVADVVEQLVDVGCRVNRHDAGCVTLATTGGAPDAGVLAALAGVERTLADAAVPQVQRGGARELAAEPFDAPDGPFARGSFSIIAGPCSVEDEETMHAIAAEVAAAGAVALRAGAYKPRSSPYSFPGLGEDGLAVLRRAADAHGLMVVSEVMDATQIAVASRYCDVLQVGARNMYNAPLLRELGRARKPVLLKRGLSATIDEWLNAAEYVASSGNPRVILCERGIRTFETATRNTLDLNAVAVARSRTDLPVFVDPSHGIGLREHVPTMALAAVAAGADGLLIEVHVNPDKALSDARQTIDMAALRSLILLATTLRRALGEPPGSRSPTHIGLYGGCDESQTLRRAKHACACTASTSPGLLGYNRVQTR